MDQPHQMRAATATAVNSGASRASATPGLAATPRTRPRHREFPAEPAQLAHVRRFVRQSLANCATADDAVLLTSELATNAIQHSRSGHGGALHVLIWHDCPSVRIAVIDSGSATTPAVTEPDYLHGSGRGLLLVQELAACWGHDGDQHGRTVWLELHCPATSHTTIPKEPER